MHPDNCIPNDDSRRVAADDYEREKFLQFPREGSGGLVEELNSWLFTRLPPTMTLAEADRVKTRIYAIIHECWCPCAPKS